MAAETDRERAGVQIGRSAAPAWHKDVLAERLRRLDNGNETTSSWTEAKERIRAQIMAGHRAAARAIE